MIRSLQASGPMYEFVVTLFVAVGSVFALLLVIIVLGKAWREAVERRQRRRRAELEPALFKYVIGNEPITAHLPRGLGTADHEVVEQIFFDLGRVVKGAVQDRARDAFETLGFVDHYHGRLRSRRWWARAEAAEKLGLMGSAKATGGLVEAMSDPMSEVRVRAARALGSIGTTEALAPLVRALRDPGRWSAIRVGGILIGAGDEAVEILLKDFPTMPRDARISAIDIFGRIRSLKAIPLLSSLLRSADADERARAAFSLGSVGDPGCAPALMEALRDPSWAVRAMAARALGRLKAEGSISALCAALSDPEWWVRANAAEALKNKGDMGRRALLEMLDGSDTFASQQAVQMLQESGVLDSLISQLGSPETSKRQQALDVMAKMVKLRRTDLLTEIAHSHPESAIRQRLAIILGLRPEPQPVG
ncbi:MAG: HEAT repeat domain-containing protein [Candidatus Polarisedimenticolia bacterium]